MKKKLLVISLFFVGAISMALFNIACEDDPKEACEQDIFCEGEPEITLCCTDGKDCYWTYDGNEYLDTEQGLDDLYNDLGCATTKSGEKSDNRDYIMTRLLEMRDRVIKASLR